MAKELHISTELIRKAWDHPDIPAALERTAKRIAADANSIAQSEDAEADYTVVTGKRPKGRPYANVIGPRDQEFGTAKTPRKRILGRAAARSAKP